MLKNIRMRRLLAGDKGAKRLILSRTLFILNHLRRSEIMHYCPKLKKKYREDTLHERNAKKTLLNYDEFSDISYFNINFRGNIIKNCIKNMICYTMFG